MKKSLFILLLLCSYLASTQTPWNPFSDGIISTEQTGFLNRKLNHQPGFEISQKLEILQADENVLSVYPVEIGNINDYLDGGRLAFKNPLTNEEYSFEADYVVDHGNGEYFWLGYSSDGGLFSLSSTAYGVKGSLDLPHRESFHEIITLGNLEHYFVERKHPDVNAGVVEECGTDSDGPLNEIYEDDYIEERCGEDAVSILFLTTPGVWAVANPRQVARTTIDEMNAVASASGVDWVYVSAGVDDLVGFTQRPAMAGVGADENILNDLNDIQSNQDYISKRDYHNADLTVILVPVPYVTITAAGIFLPGGIFGAVKDIAANRDDAYSIVAVGMANTGFTAVHEIGHLLGARHERCEIFCPGAGCDSRRRFHGFLLGDGTSQTILARRGCGLARIARFSEKEGTFTNPATGMVFATGDRENQNAKIINRCSARASCYETGQPVTGFDPVDLTQGYVGIQGPSIIADCPNGEEWLAIVGELFQNPISYTWEYSETGIGNWTWIGNEEVLSRSALPFLPSESFFLRLHATDNFGNWGYASKVIQVAFCLGGDNGGNALISQDNGIKPQGVFAETKVTTLPTTINKEINQIIIYDISGRQLEKVNNKAFSDFRLRDFVNTGVYFIFTQYKDGSYDVQKMVNLY